MVPAQIQTSSLAHVHYQHPNLPKALNFLRDFGLVVEKEEGDYVYLRGYGSQPYVYIASKSPDAKRHFLGSTWAVASLSELEKAARHPNAAPGGPQNSVAPGGGQTVTLVDPLGNHVHFIHGQALRSDVVAGEASQDTLETGTSMSANHARTKPRTGDVRRFAQGPSPVHKLGHYGYMVPASKFDEMLQWYTSTLNIVPTDTIFDPASGKDETTFFHIDLGDEWSDHHSFFLASHPTSDRAHVHHASFEVNDTDTQQLGHDWLRARLWTNCWGVGRHVLGSQVFDYWFDASGNILEHYSDGDVVNRHTRYTREPASPHSLFVWGPNVPLGFLTGRVEDAGLPAPAPPAPPVSEHAVAAETEGVGGPVGGQAVAAGGV